MKTKTRYPRLVVAGMKGGSGKTTVALGLIAAWREKGLDIAPYKKGPDYIDAGWLSSAAGRACYNLDPFLISREKIRSSFMEHYGSADGAVIEGNRGLYDGMDSEGTYSTAELSKMLSAPVILVIDCTKVTRTSAAMVLGMKLFDPAVDIRGIILNQVSGARHEKVIRETIEKYCQIPVLGAIPRLKQDFLSERHMGLTPFQEHPEVDGTISFAADLADRYLDLNRIWEILGEAGRLSGELRRRCGAVRRVETAPAVSGSGDKITVGIVRDSAFQFYYPENFEELQRRGASLIEISAMKEKKLPALDALYIGGGFPETHAIALARNKTFRKSLQEAVESGLPVYAECGGLMYLGEAIILDRRKYPMTGIFPVTFSLERRPQAHGYTVIDVTAQNPFYERGSVLKGHEFHYSRVVDIGKKKGMKFAFSVRRGQGIVDKRDGICYKNVLATYTHLHALGSPEWAEGLLARAMAFHKKRKGSLW